jgi:hypothetical protein
MLRNQIAIGDESILFLDKTVPLKDERVNFALAMVWQLIIIYVQSYREELKYSIPQFQNDNKIVLIDSIEFCNNLIESDWPDLKNFRNQVIAHGYRDRENQSLFKNKQIESFRIPKTGIDFTKLTATIKVLHQCIRAEYENIFKTFNLMSEPFFKGVNINSFL